MAATLKIESTSGGGVAFDVKVVPGASRDQVVGLLGTALKVKVAAPPEDGKANAAVCALLAKTLGLPARDVTVVAGHSRPQKRVEARGISVEAALSRLL